MEKFNPATEEDHFGLITFNKNADLAFSFANSKYHDKEALLERIADEPVKLHLQTRTDLALKMALDELFTEGGGDRPDKLNVMIVFTDGKPTHPGKSFNFEAFAARIENEFKVSHYLLVTVSHNELQFSIVPMQVPLTSYFHFSFLHFNFLFCNTN